MSTLQKFLIKSARMEKEARTAIAKRLLASTMAPEEVIKRFGKVRGNRYLDDITTAVKNHVNSPAVSGSNNVDTRAYLRRTLADNAAKQLHFNNRLNKADYLKHIASNPLVENSRLTYNRIVNRADLVSGLSRYYSILPRQDKFIVSKYLRGIVPESEIQHLSKDVQRAAQDARAQLLYVGRKTTLLEKSQYAKTLQQEYGIKSREELIKEMQDRGIDFNPDELQHSHYVTGKYNNPLYSSMIGRDRDHMLLAATKLPYTSNDRLPAQAAAVADVLTTSSTFGKQYLGANTSKLPRSVQKALQIIKGENLLEPGTRANRLFNKAYNNKALNDKLRLTARMQEFMNGENAAYDPYIDAILVHPTNIRGVKNVAGIEAHERGHRAAFTMAPDAHADEAFREFRKMQLLGKKYNMNVPLDDSELMQEAFAESYVRKLLGPNSGASVFDSPRQKLRYTDTTGLPEAARKEFRRGKLAQYKANMDAINAMRTSEDTKDLFRQLAFNYGHSFV